MKRKSICYVLCVVMMLSMTGCKSQNYLKAVDLFENGQYSQIGEVFANLKDYEDSIAMVRECNYRIAIETMEAMEEKSYLQAKEYWK